MPQVLSAPTVIANGELPGEVIVPKTGCPGVACPRLPADATTMTPAADHARDRRSTADPPRTAPVTGCPSDRLTTRMPYRVAVGDHPVEAGDDAAGLAAAFAPSTRTLTRCAPGAIAAGVVVGHAAAPPRLPGDDARDVRAVAELVVGLGSPGTKLTAATTLLASARAPRCPNRRPRRQRPCR